MKKDAARPRACPVLDTGVIRRGIDCRGCYRGERPACETITGRSMRERRSLAQGEWRQGWGRAARREAASLLSTADRRMVRRLPCNIRCKPAHVEAAARFRVSHAAGMRSRSKRQTCLQQAGTLRPTGGGRGAGCTPSLSPTDEAINPNRQTGSQRKERSTPTGRRVSSGRSDQLQSLNGCPTGGGLITPTAGLDRGRRAKSTPSFRSALPAKGLITPLRQHSLVGDRGRANHPPVVPVQQGSRTQVSMVGNLGKSQTVRLVSPLRDPQKRACDPPFANRRQIVH